MIAYLDPASNPGSKPQRLGATNFKSSTSDKLQTFRTISFIFATMAKVSSELSKSGNSFSILPEIKKKMWILGIMFCFSHPNFGYVLMGRAGMVSN